MSTEDAAVSVIGHLVTNDCTSKELLWREALTKANINIK